MQYKDSLPVFEKIAQRGIPIRDPEIVQKWARTHLFMTFEDLNSRFKGTVDGVERWEFISDAKWSEAVESGSIQPMLNRAKLKELWELFDYPEPGPKFNFSPTDFDLLAEFDGDPGLAGDLFRLYKRRNRLSGICGGWLSSYQSGRLYYGTLNPFGCTTGRCAPCPSNGFLPGMGHEITDALLNPEEGKEISILDYRSQGLCIMAALSQDPVMVSLATAKKDPYLGLGRILGAIPVDEYSSMSVDSLRVKFAVERERFKKLMLAYQYGAGGKRIARILGKEEEYGVGMKRGLDSLFKVYCQWRKGLKSEYPLPDGFIATGSSPSVTAVQGTDAYILRRVLMESQDWDVIATNHDCLWVEHDSGVDVSPLARLMEQIADDVTNSTGLFRVRVETVKHRS